MTVEVRNERGVAVVAPKGDVDLRSSPALRRELLRCVAGGHDVLVDLSGVGQLDSSGVAGLVEAFGRARKAGARFALAGVGPSALQMLRLARLDTVFAVHASVEDALKGA